MALSIGKVRGISPAHAKTLRQHGLGDINKYLAATKTAEKRRALAQELNVSEQMILEHANRCDLARVKGIGEVFSNLLENAGVDTVKELATRVPQNLYEKLAETNVGKRYAQRNPTLKEVKNWVAQAKRLPKLLEY
jgi:predicted flap endonuclease-1-like 5' DNA nuclease